MAMEESEKQARSIEGASSEVKGSEVNSVSGKTNFHHKGAPSTWNFMFLLWKCGT